MKTSPQTLRTAARRSLALLLCWGQIVPALAAPAQEPLLGRSGGAVLPNVMFTLDDSGSMSWNVMPEQALEFGSDKHMKLHPGEPDEQFVGGVYTASGALHRYPYAGTVATRLNDWMNARQRSSAWNRIYYDPEVRYQPWTQADGTLKPAANPAAAQIDPINTAWGTVNLKGETVYSGNICYTNSSSAPTCGARTNEPVAPATWYNYIGPSMASMTFAQRDTATRNAANFTRVRIMDHATFNHGEGRTDCAEVSTGVRQCTQAQEYQNFANWYTWNHKRYSQAVTALSAAFAAQDAGRMRFGYGRLNATFSFSPAPTATPILTPRTVDGSSDKYNTIERGVRLYDATTRAALFNWLFTTQPMGATSLPGAQDDVGRYFSRSDDRGPWGKTPGTADATSHLACRKSYHILMTDGEWNTDRFLPTASPAWANIDGQNGPVITGPGGQSWQYVPEAPFKDTVSQTLADVAMYYWNRDLRPGLDNRVPTTAEDPAFWQNLTTYTIGFGVSGLLNHPGDLPALVAGTRQWTNPYGDAAGLIDDLWHAAVNGRGRHLSAQNGPELTKALRGILADIVRRSGGTAGVSVSGRALAAGTRKFVPSYLTGDWSGNLTAFSVLADGTTGAEIWNANAKLPAHTARNIVVGTGSSSAPRAIPFTWTSLGAAPAVMSALGGSATEPVVNWLRGDRGQEGIGLRVRQALIGDVVNSTPIHVKDAFNGRYQQMPAGTPGRDSYAAFLDTKKARDGLVWFGANDGMLHAVRASDGVEVFAFIPNAVLGHLAALSNPAYTHRYTVDGPLTESDAWLGGAWKNVLVGSTGAGARSVFALDVTTPTSPGTGSVLWELDAVSQPELGHVLAPIEVGRLRDGRWAAVFGNGYDSASQKASLFIVNLADGSLIKRLDTGAGGASAPNGLGGVRVVRDGQQTLVGAYAGDLLGNVWKFDLGADSAAGWKVSFDGSPLHVLKRADDSRQAVTAAPAVVSHPSGGNMVLVGTGRLFADGDQDSTASESLYGLWDQQKLAEQGDGSWRWSAGTAIASADRVKAGSLTVIDSSDYYTIAAPTINWAVDRGWSLPLSMALSQRVTQAPQLVTGLALFETVVPVTSGSSEPCDARAGADGYNLLIDPIGGGMSVSPVLDLNGDGMINSADAAIGGWKTSGWGGASIVLRDPPRTLCTGSGCVAAPASPCPAGQIRSNLQNTGAGGTNVCVTVPGPQRWWWRQVANP